VVFEFVLGGGVEVLGGGVFTIGSPSN